METGLRIASENKDIPYVELMEWLRTLAKNEFVYSWDFKSITVREYNLRVKFVCYLTTKDFTIRMSAFDKKNGACIYEGQVIRTLPDSIFFAFILSKKVKLNDSKIIISDGWEREMVYIEVKDVLEGNFVVKYSPSPDPDDEKMTEQIRYLQSVLKYDNDKYDHF